MEEELVPLPLPATPLETLPGFDLSAGTSWIYPVNYPIRWVPPPYLGGFC
jgi:hypothetical protein